MLARGNHQTPPAARSLPHFSGIQSIVRPSRRPVYAILCGHFSARWSDLGSNWRLTPISAPAYSLPLMAANWMAANKKTRVLWREPG